MVLFGGIMRRREERRARVAKAMAEGIAQERAKWQAWNRRRLEAEAEGRPFNEPPPSKPPSENNPEVP